MTSQSQIYSLLSIAKSVTLTVVFYIRDSLFTSPNGVRLVLNVNKVDVKQSLISIEVTLAIKTEKSQVCTLVFRVHANDRALSTITLSRLFYLSWSQRTHGAVAATLLLYYTTLSNTYNSTLSKNAKIQKQIFSFLFTGIIGLFKCSKFYRQSNLYSPLGKLCHYSTFCGSLQTSKVCSRFYVLWLLIENSTLTERK